MYTIGERTSGIVAKSLEYMAMNQRELNKLLPLNGEPLPFRLDEGGVVRIGNSRITLDLLVEQYENGMSPEDMVRAYDTLALADVHAAIAYYLRHRNGPCKKSCVS